MLRVLGVPQAVSQLLAVATRVQAAAPKATEVVADEVANDARGLVPVLTGETRASIIVTPEGVEAGGASLYLELGTSRMSAHPFLRPAADGASGDAAMPILRAAVGVL